jgi:hypothetical protein
LPDDTCHIIEHSTKGGKIVNILSREGKGRLVLVIALILTMAFSMVGLSNTMAIGTTYAEDGAVAEGGWSVGEEPEPTETRTIMIEIYKSAADFLEIRPNELRWHVDPFVAEYPYIDLPSTRISVDGREWQPFQKIEPDGPIVQTPFELDWIGIDLRQGWTLLDATVIDVTWQGDPPIDTSLVGASIEEWPEEANGYSGRVRIHDSVYDESVAKLLVTIALVPDEPPISDREVSISVQDAEGAILSDGYTVNWYKNDEQTPLGSGNPITLYGVSSSDRYYVEVVLDESLSAVYRTPYRQRFEPRWGTAVYTLFEKNENYVTLRVEANIDGVSELVLQDGTIFWNHLDWAAPGRHNGMDVPTILNGYEWMPWEGRDGELRGPYPVISDPLSLSAVGLDPTQTWEVVGLEGLDGRGAIVISRWPSAENEYTSGVIFDDDWAGSDMWYSVNLILRAVDTPSVGAPGSGDIDGDGVVTADEALSVVYAVVNGNIDLSPAQIAALDVDFDGALTMFDAIVIMQRAMGMNV